MEPHPAEKTNLGNRRAKKQDKSISKKNEAYNAKRKEIIDVSLRLFSENGYSNTSISDIAAQLKMDRATLYYYVSSKEEIYKEISTIIAVENVTEIERIANSDLSPKTKLTEAMIYLNRSYHDSFPILQIFLNKLLEEMRFDVSAQTVGREWSERYYKAMKAILEQGRDQGCFEFKLPVGVVALGIIGMLNWAQATSQRYGRGNAHGRITPEAIGAGFAETIFNGILAKDAAR